MHRHRALGYGMVALAATLFAINGTVSKVILGSGVDAQQLTEARCAGALIGLTLIVLVTRPTALPLRRGELPLIGALGVVGLALVQWSYFFAIHRVAIGVALVVQFVGPILVALWARFVYGEHVRARIWVALVLALIGLLLIVEIWTTDRPNGAGLAAAALAAVTYAAYILLAERGVRGRDPISLSAWGFFFATLFWSLVAPWWNFPTGRVGSDVSLLGNVASQHLPVWALMLWMIVLGTIIPFALVVGALRPDQRHARRDHRDARAGRGDRRRLGVARRVAEPRANIRRSRYPRRRLTRPVLPLIRNERSEPSSPARGVHSCLTTTKPRTCFRKSMSSSVFSQF